MNLRASMIAGFARQLAQPQGVRGLLTGAMLNRANRADVTAAVRALPLTAGDTVADLGFGGGVGLDLLLRHVGTSGHVDGVDMSATMLRHASRRFRRDVAAGRLRLHAATMTELPLATDSLDGAITLNTIYFIHELNVAFAELARVTKRSGQVVIGLGDPDAMAGSPLTVHNFRLRSVPEVIDLLQNAGLTVEEQRRVGGGKRAFHLLVAKPSQSAV
ncbi:MAG: methyltransferase domain-containing protein [Thermoanaerobaculia bacterium]